MSSLPPLSAGSGSGEEKPTKLYEIDWVGTGTHVHLHNVLQRRNYEPLNRPEGNCYVCKAI